MRRLNAIKKQALRYLGGHATTGSAPHGNSLLGLVNRGWAEMVLRERTQGPPEGEGWKLGQVRDDSRAWIRLTDAGREALDGLQVDAAQQTEADGT